jgi:hypothetical protein
LGFEPGMVWQTRLFVKPMKNIDKTKRVIQTVKVSMGKTLGEDKQKQLKIYLLFLLPPALISLVVFCLSLLYQILLRFF